MTALWTSRDMEAATLGHATRGFDVQGISIDTRTLKPRDLFIALKTENREGHQFVASALDRRAGAVMVSYRPDNVAEDAPLLIKGSPDSRMTVILDALKAGGAT